MYMHTTYVQIGFLFRMTTAEIFTCAAALWCMPFDAKNMSDFGGNVGDHNASWMLTRQIYLIWSKKKGRRTGEQWKWVWLHESRARRFHHKQRLSTIMNEAYIIAVTPHVYSSILTCIHVCTCRLTRRTAAAFVVQSAHDPVKLRIIPGRALPRLKVFHERRARLKRRHLASRAERVRVGVVWRHRYAIVNVTVVCMHTGCLNPNTSLHGGTCKLTLVFFISSCLIT